MSCFCLRSIWKASLHWILMLLLTRRSHRVLKLRPPMSPRPANSPRSAPHQLFCRRSIIRLSHPGDSEIIHDSWSEVFAQSFLQVSVLCWPCCREFRFGFNLHCCVCSCFTSNSRCFNIFKCNTQTQIPWLSSLFSSFNICLVVSAGN